MAVKFIAPLLMAAMAIVAATARADGGVDKAVADKIRATLEVPSTGLKVGSIRNSPIAGVYEVQFSNGPTVFSSSDGDFFVVGDLFAVQGEQFVNVSEQGRDTRRKEQLEALDPADMIVFSPAGDVKASITVFTDITCGYCQKLHREVADMNKYGIEVRYLAYPRAGLGTDGYRLLATAWCADNRQATLTRLKNREKVADNVCENNPVADQFRLGQAMGVRGTPAIVLDTGEMIPGYQSADDLALSLGLE